MDRAGSGPGVYAGLDLGPVMRSEPGEAPYPETMSRAAAAEIAAIGPDAVVAKCDLTAAGTPEQLELFLACFGTGFGDRLHYVKGNHGVASGDRLQAPAARMVELPGARLALFDTAVPGRSTGDLRVDQLEWLDQVGAEASTDGCPVLVFGRHPPRLGGVARRRHRPGRFTASGGGLRPPTGAGRVVGPGGPAGGDPSSRHLVAREGQAHHPSGARRAPPRRRRRADGGDPRPPGRLDGRGAGEAVVSVDGTQAGLDSLPG